VVERLVVDVARNILFFEAADAVLEAGGAGNGPGARERLRIALVGQVSVWRVGLRCKVHGNSGILLTSGTRQGSAPLARYHRKE